MGGDAWRLGRFPRVWRKVMAAYRRLYGFGHLRLTAEDRDQLGNPYAGFEYWDYLYL